MYIETFADIIEVGRRLYAKDLVTANDGNISVKINDKYIAATPSGVSKGFIKTSDLSVLDLDGNIIDGPQTVTSEIKMHLEIYRKNPSITAIVHAHPTYATTLAALGKTLDPELLLETQSLLGEIPLVGAYPLGSKTLAINTARFASDYKGVLLKKHGAVAWSGNDVFDALFNMERIEFAAKITYFVNKRKSRKVAADNEH